MLFGSGFSLVFGIILVVLAIVFFMGKGSTILSLFGDKSSVNKERSPEKERRYQRAIAIFLLVLAAGEFLTLIIQNKIMGIVTIAIAVGAIVGIGIYFKKYL